MGDKKKDSVPSDILIERGRFFELPLDMLCVINAEGKFKQVSGGWERVVGFASNELYSQPFIEFIHQEDRKITKQALVKLSKGQETVQFENRFSCKDGSYKWLSWHAICHENNLIYAIAHDVTLRKEMEERFLANMSHVIRNPMNVIVGMTGLLLLGELSAQQREFIENINLSGEELLNIVNDVLFYLKIEAGKLTIEKLRFNLQEVTENVIQELIKKAHSKGINIILEIEKETPLNLIGDPIVLRQILFNLIENAVNFTFKGKIIIKIVKEFESDSQIVLTFSVKDTGIGLLPEEQQRLFQAFTQSESLKYGKLIGGSGLGLAISKKLVNLLEGELFLDSVPNVGSTFFCSLQFEKQAVGGVVEQREEPLNLKETRTLIVDDHTVDPGKIHQQLLSIGIRADLVKDRKDALKALRFEASGKDPYRLLIVDLQKPELEGLRFLTEVLDYPSLRLMKLMITTRSGENIPKDKLQIAKVAATISKPIETLALQNLITRTLEGRPQAQEASPQLDAEKAGKAKVLVVEDFIVSQKLAVLQLQKLGYHADVASNGLEALEAVERNLYDIILMDCEMPRMNGYEATREIRKNEGGKRHALVIAMTANAMEGDREKCLEAGMDDYIGKPVKLETLALTLAKWANWSQPLQ